MMQTVSPPHCGCSVARIFLFVLVLNSLICLPISQLDKLYFVQDGKESILTL